jgi:probable phosphoglycerate mutase
LITPDRIPHAGGLPLSGQTRIHLVRHGQVHNPQNIVYGRMPRFRLSAKGIQQVRMAGRFFGSRSVAALYSSPLLRARQSARELQEATSQARIRISRLITEVASPFEGRPAAEADTLGGDVYTGAGAGFEQPQDILDRTKRFMMRIANRYAGRHVAAVTHGDVVVFALLWARGHVLDPKLKGRLDFLGVKGGYPAHGSVTTFTFDSNRVRARPAVRYWTPD